MSSATAKMIAHVVAETPMTSRSRENIVDSFINELMLFESDERRFRAACFDDGLELAEAA